MSKTYVEYKHEKFYSINCSIKMKIKLWICWCFYYKLNLTAWTLQHFILSLELKVSKVECKNYWLLAGFLISFFQQTFHLNPNICLTVFHDLLFQIDLWGLVSISNLNVISRRSLQFIVSFLRTQQGEITFNRHRHLMISCIIFPLDFVLFSQTFDSFLIFIWSHDEIDFNLLSALSFSSHMATFFSRPLHLLSPPASQTRIYYCCLFQLAFPKWFCIISNK